MARTKLYDGDTLLGGSTTMIHSLWDEKCAIMSSRLEANSLAKALWDEMCNHAIAFGG